MTWAGVAQRAAAQFSTAGFVFHRLQFVPKNLARLCPPRRTDEQSFVEIVQFYFTLFAIVRLRIDSQIVSPSGHGASRSAEDDCGWKRWANPTCVLEQFPGVTWKQGAGFPKEKICSPRPANSDGNRLSLHPIQSEFVEATVA